MAAIFTKVSKNSVSRMQGLLPLILPSIFTFTLALTHNMQSMKQKQHFLEALLSFEIEEAWALSSLPNFLGPIECWCKDYYHHISYILTGAQLLSPWLFWAHLYLLRR